MWSQFLPKLLILFTLFISIAFIQAQVDETSFPFISDALEWPITTSSLSFLTDDDVVEKIEFDGSDEVEDPRRSLFWRATRYYISYGALSANRIPCPPRSGRSYYTHNCYKARGPANPYTRGCSRITRCRR
ncbi:Rapid ALkalinization Factor [Dillenia turbinata]|uniref:Rapid ALkalinization Factor n=1 Tax=Dillenia turbinata TaxID=194707 RepID=A0AAN8V3N9_9MAGN